MPSNKHHGPAVRTEEPERRQAEMCFVRTIDELVDDKHSARLIWRVVSAMNLERFTEHARARFGSKGREVKSPAMMLTLWLYGISRGIGSAREIARRITTDAPFRWIAGNVSVSHQALSAFRTSEGAALQQLMIDVLASLMEQGLLSLDLVGQDGTRVRASASAPSFRRESSLKECQEQARLHLHAVLSQADDPEVSEQVKRAREEKARDFQRRVEAALVTVANLSNERPKKAKKDKTPDQWRASTTDADARVMKMGDGGFRPAYNLQVAVAGSELGGPRAVVGLCVTNVGSDMGSITPMLNVTEAWTGQLPGKLLADANHAKHECIDNAAERGVELFMTVNERSRASVATSPHVKAWRDRMSTDEAKRIYRARAGLVELFNGIAKGVFGQTQMPLRGLPKVHLWGLWVSLSFNITQNLAALA